jgi:hypothetical protein
MKKVTVDELLKESRKVLMERRWIRGAYNDHGAVCALGAIEVVCRKLKVDSDTKEKAKNRLHKASGLNSITSFNDRETTTKSDVVSAFTRALYRKY